MGLKGDNRIMSDVKIVQLLYVPDVNNGGDLLGLGSDGVTYKVDCGRWVVDVEALKKNKKK